MDASASEPFTKSTKIVILLSPKIYHVLKIWPLLHDVVRFCIMNVYSSHNFTHDRMVATHSFSIHIISAV